MALGYSPKKIINSDNLHSRSPNNTSGNYELQSNVLRYMKSLFIIYLTSGLVIYSDKQRT